MENLISVMCILIILLIVTLLTCIVYLIKFSGQKTSHLEFEECINILSVIITSELQAYDNDIFNGQHQLSNNTYEKYCRMISLDISKSIPNTFYKTMQNYITAEALDRLIVRRVKSYLQEKIKTHST